MVSEEWEMATYRFSIASVTASEVSVDIAIAWPKPTIPSAFNHLFPSTPTCTYHTKKQQPDPSDQLFVDRK